MALVGIPLWAHDAAEEHDVITDHRKARPGDPIRIGARGLECAQRTVVPDLRALDIGVDDGKVVLLAAHDVEVGNAADLVHGREVVIARRIDRDGRSAFTALSEAELLHRALDDGVLAHGHVLRIVVHGYRRSERR